MRDVYVVAVLGESPAVLTELWWALHQRGDRIVGLEIWTTLSGRSALSKQGPRLFRQTAAALGVPSILPDPLPRYNERVTTDALPRGFGTLGPNQDDLRTAADCAELSYALHDRMRDLYNEPCPLPIVGSLAGGRKTTSAALQSAFCLHGRRNDSLLHVLLHADLEAHLREQRILPTYACPTEALAEQSGVPVADQVLLVDVPFLRVRELVSGHSKALAGMLRDRDNRDLWRALPTESEVRATYGPKDGTASHDLLIYAGSDLIASVRLKQLQAALYGALARARTLTVAQAIAAHAGHLRGFSTPTEKLTRDAVARLITNMEELLRDAPPSARAYVPTFEDDTVTLTPPVNLLP